MSNRISVVIPSELEAYEEAIKISGLAASDFNLTQHPGPREHTQPAISGIVKIKYKPTEIERSYNICMGSSWPIGFQNDLNEGHFG